MNLPVLVLGGGGHAKVLIETLQLRLIPILGIVDIDSGQHGANVLGVTVVGDEDLVNGFAPDALLLANALGSIHLPLGRMALYRKFKARGFTFATVIHPSAVVSSYAIIGEGCQIMAGAVIQPCSVIGNNTIINSRASVDHDCVIGEHSHLAPGVTVSGGVTIGNAVHLGVGASVIQGVTIGSNSLIGAGSVVVTNVPENSEYLGVPARPR